MASREDNTSTYLVYLISSSISSVLINNSLIEISPKLLLVITVKRKALVL